MRATRFQPPPSPESPDYNYYYIIIVVLIYNSVDNNVLHFYGGYNLRDYIIICALTDGV